MQITYKPKIDLKKNICGTMKLTLSSSWGEDKKPFSWEMIDFGYDHCDPEPTIDNCCIQGFLCEAKQDFLPGMFLHNMAGKFVPIHYVNYCLLVGRFIPKLQCSDLYLILIFTVVGNSIVSDV